MQPERGASGVAPGAPLVSSADGGAAVGVGAGTAVAVAGALAAAGFQNRPDPSVRAAVSSGAAVCPGDGLGAARSGDSRVGGVQPGGRRTDPPCGPAVDGRADLPV